MKLLISLVFFIIYSLVGFSQIGKKGLTVSDSLLIEKIKNSNPNVYIGKSLNEYLSNNALKKYKEWLPVDEPPGKLYSIILSYSEKVWVEIIFTDILHQKKFSEKMKWDFPLLKKEKIYKINYSWEE
jgi:hypothetical protein